MEKVKEDIPTNGYANGIENGIHENDLPELRENEV